MLHKIKSLPLLGQIFIVILSFWVGLFFAWQTLSATHFFYPQIYDTLDFEPFIETLAPQNRYKSGFENTDRNQHIALFGEIVDAINNKGQNLSRITYHDSEGNVIGTLLREPEVIHLQDVANLLDTLRTAAYWAMVILLIIITLFRVTKTPLQHIGYTLLITLGIVAMIAVSIIIYGTRDIFYQLHTIVFPENHQWFFYYQESLMTTLMKAPDIFAVIAALLTGLAFLYFSMILWTTTKLLNINNHYFKNLKGESKK